MTYAPNSRFYSAQPLNVSCYFPNIPDDESFYQVDLRLGNYGLYCQRNSEPAKWVKGVDSPQGSTFPFRIRYKLTNDECDDLRAPDNRMTVQFTITASLLYLPMFCRNQVTEKTAQCSELIKFFVSSLTIFINEANSFSFQICIHVVRKYPCEDSQNLGLKQYMLHLIGERSCK